MSLPTETRQWVTLQDGTKNLKQQIVPLPTIGDGEVLVKINAVSLNYRDTEGMCMNMFLFECSRCFRLLSKLQITILLFNTRDVN